MPIPLYIALAFADMFEDLCLTDMRFGSRRKVQTGIGGKQPICAVTRSVSGAILDFLWKVMFFTGPLDLVDIDIQDRHNVVKVKVLTK